MVFARYIAFILSTFLGKFIKGLNKDSVNFSLLKGSFELKNVELAPDLLSFSDYLQLESGTIGSFSVIIPWHSLYSRRCEVIIRDVAIVVAPKYGHQVKTTSFFKSKEEFLAAVQAVLADENKEEKIEKEAKSGFLHRLTQTVLKNLVFRLESVSFQLEDKSCSWQGCSAGVRAQIGKLTCEATDAQFTPVFTRPEDRKGAPISLYRIIAYENIVIRLLYADADVAASNSDPSQAPGSSNTPSRFTQLDDVLFSSRGVLTAAWEGAQAPEHTRPSLSVTLVVSEGGASLNPQCIAALGVLSESLRFAPQRAYAWSMRPRRRPGEGNYDDAAKWWRYSIQKVIEWQKASRKCSRFSWKHYVRRKHFLNDFFLYCLLLLKAPWLPGGAEANVDEEQLAQTSIHDVMTCWNAARWYVRQHEKNEHVPEGSLYAQYIKYLCFQANDSGDGASRPSNLSVALMDVDLAIECAQLSAKLDESLRTTLSRLCIAASKKGEDIYAQFSVASVAVVAQNKEGNPLLSLNGNDAAALLTVAKAGSTPVHGRVLVDSVITCLDFSFQELLLSKIASCIAAAKPFMHQRFSKPAKTQKPQNTANSQEKTKAMQAFNEQSFSQFTIVVKAVVAGADGVSLGIKNFESVLSPDDPVEVKIQQIVATVNDDNLLQLFSITVKPVLNEENVSVGVATTSASLSTNIESFEYVKLLLGATANRWKKEAGSVAAQTSSFFKPTNEAAVVDTDNSSSSGSSSGTNSRSDSRSPPVKLSVCFDFIEFGAFALDAFAIQATLGDGWHAHLCAAGATTEGWCHSSPPQPHDPFIDIDVWADAYLQTSPFAGNIEGNGIGFVFLLNHVTLCLGDELAATAEALFDLTMLLIFDDEDRHVHLRNDQLYTIPHISGRLVGSNVKFLLESDGGDLTLLPGYAAAMKDEESRDAFVIPVPPMPVTVELLGKDCLDVTFHRYGDKRMHIAVVLEKGVNAFLRGTPAHIPLLPPRDSTRAEINIHLSAPSEADLPVFPYSRVDIAMKLSEVAVIAHIPTIMALWSNFNTPSLPLGRIRNVGNRVHFFSRPSRLGKTLAPRSPASATVEAIGVAALVQSSPFAWAAPQGENVAAAASQQPSPIYTTSVFPSDVTLRVEVVRSELYYPWGDGSVAPLFMHAMVSGCEIDVLSRDECVEVGVRGVMSMPSVATSFYASPPLPAAASPMQGSQQAAEQSDHTVAESTTPKVGCVSSRNDSEAAVAPSALPKDAKRSGCTASADPESNSHSGEHSNEARQQRPPTPHVVERPSSDASVSDLRENASPMLSAFPDGEDEGSAAMLDTSQKNWQWSSAVQVRVMYTMDSRPPYRPGSSNESLDVSLSGTAVPGSRALPGPLHICMRNPAEVGAWLTFFTFFNPANTVPLSTADTSVFATVAGPSNDDLNNNHRNGGGTTGENAGKSTSTASSSNSTGNGPSNARGMKTLVRLTPIVLHLPFAGAAAILWDGIEFSAVLDYNALRIPQLEVLVHEELLVAEGPARLGAKGSSFEKLRELREGGFSVLSLPGSRENGGCNVAAMPGVLLETRQQGPTAADVRRQLIIPALQAQVSQKTSFEQLQLCATLSAVSTVLAARSAQCALLNAVIQNESQQRGLQYGCCAASQANYDSTAHARMLAQLQPFLSPPTVMLFQNVCFTYDWESSLQRDVRAGLTVALHNLRCNDYATCSRIERQRSEGTGAAAGNGARSPSLCSSRGSAAGFSLSLSMPFALEVSSTDAYVWWASMDSDLVALVHHVNQQNSSASPSSRLTRNMEEEEGGNECQEENERSVEGGRRSTLPSSVGTCMPLLLYPVRVHTSISTGISPATVAATDNGDTNSSGKPNSSTSNSQSVDDSAATRSDEIQDSDTSSRSADGTQNSLFNRTPHAASTASFHTMPSTSSYDSPASAKAPMSPLCTADDTVTPVLEVSPVHVILSTSAYVMLSDALMHEHRRHPDENRRKAAAESSPQVTVKASTYSLVRHEASCPHRKPQSSLSASLLEMHTPPKQQQSQPAGSFISSSGSASSDNNGGRESSSVGVETLYRYCFDSKQQRLWLEKVAVHAPARASGQSLQNHELCVPAASLVGEASTTNQQGNDVDAAVTFIPLSSVNAASGFLSSAFSAQLATGAGGAGLGNADSSEMQTMRTSSGPTPPQTPAAAAPVRSANQRSSLAAAVCVTTLPPFTSPRSEVPRLQSRVSVTELCVRLVRSQDLEPSFSVGGEADDFWQRYAAVHTAVRRVAIAVENSFSATTTSDPPAPSVLTFLANAVPALRTLSPHRSSAPSASRSHSGSGANHARPRAGSCGLVSLLEDNGADALCIQLHGIAVSTFTDARLIVLDSCVCTSVKSPSRPLLAVAQVEVYIPTSCVTYPSMEAVAKTVARDLQGVDAAGGRSRDCDNASEGDVHVSPVSSPSNSQTVTAVDPASKAKAASWANARASAAAPSKATDNATSAGGGRPVVMMGEVGCRVSAITVDISAIALRAWLSCLVEQPVAALRAAAEEKEKWLALWGAHTSTNRRTEEEDPAAVASEAAAGTDNPAAAAPGSSLVEPRSLLRWKPGRGLRIYEAREATWSLEHDITLSRNGLVLFFSSYNTNLMTVKLNGYSVILDEALLLQPDGLQRTVMVIQGGLTVRFVGSGRVQVPLGMWNPLLWDSKGNTGVEAVLLPFMAIGEGSYLECINVRLGFCEPASALAREQAGAATVTAATAALKAGVAATPLQLPTGDAPPTSALTSPMQAARGTATTTTTAAPRAAVSASPPPLTHHSVHLVLPCVSLIMEPRQESRQIHIRTSVELWASMCGGVLLRDDLRCTGLAIFAESIYDATTTTARTAVLAPVNVSVCSTNGRHHAVSLGAAQVDLGRADLLLLSTYAGEVEAVRLYAKYLTHSRVEKEFLELVEETLAWKAAAPVGILSADHDHDHDDDDDEESTGEERSAAEPEGEHNHQESSEAACVATDEGNGPRARSESPSAHETSPLPRRVLKLHRQQGGESPRLDTNEPLFGCFETELAASLRLPGVAQHESGGHVATTTAWGASVASRRNGRAEGNVTAAADDASTKRQTTTTAAPDSTPLAPDRHCGPTPDVASQTSPSAGDAQHQQRQQMRRHRRGRKHSQRTRGFSWAVFTPAIELTFSDHRYPLLQLRVQDMMLRRTSTTFALAATSFVQCEKASVRVYGRGRWDDFLLPSSTITWSLTQSVSRHSSNRHVLLSVDGIRVQCSHLIVAKLLYITRQLKALATSLQRRLAAAVAAKVAGDWPQAAADLPPPPSNTNGEGTEMQTKLDNHAPSVMSGSDSDNEDNESSNSRSRSSSSTTTTTDDASTDACVKGHRQRPSRRRVQARTTTATAATAAATCAVAKDPAPQCVTVDPAVTGLVPSSRFTRVETLATATTGATGSVPVTASMVTHRLLNSFRCTLFAGICEREALTRDAARPLDAAYAEINEEDTAPAVWRCKELYRLPPASATDIFISYRRARSLVLTFFPTGCVEWDEDTGVWVLNASGEMELAAKAVEASRIPATAVTQHSTRLKPADTDGGQREDEVAMAALAIASNWFPFTTLQYGMARPVAVRTTARAVESISAASSSLRHDSRNHSSSNNRGVVDGACTASLRPRALDMAGGSGDFSSCRIQSYALALTCVDPKEEAESLRYPIVVVPGEGEGSATLKRRRRGGQHSRVLSATSRRAFTPVSRHVSSGFANTATAGDAAVMSDEGDGLLSESACGVQQQQHQQHSRISSFTSAFPGMLPAQSPVHNRSHVSTGEGGTATHSVASRVTRRGNNPTSGGATVADDSGDGDLLVVRLQARSLLLNETGCTLQLRSLTSTTATAPSKQPSSDGGGTAAKPASVTVPPGWRLPLVEEDVHNEVLLRVRCPSARWVFTTTSAGPLHSSSSSSSSSSRDDTSGEDGDEESGAEGKASPFGKRDGAEDSGVFGGVSVDRWYEARLVLGDLDSGRFLSLNRITHPAAGAFEDQDKRPLILFVVINYSSDNLIAHISLYPRLTLVNHLGVNVRVAVFQQDRAAGPQTPDEAMLLAPWTAPYVGRGRHERERFHRSLVALGAHDALPHQHALPLHFCTYNSNLVLGLSFSQSTGDALITADLEPVVTYLREAVDHHPRMLLLHDSHGRTFYVQVSVMPRTVVLSVALWVYNLTEYPLLLCDSVVTRRLCPGQSSTTGIIPSQGEPFLIGCRLADFTQGFFAIGLDGGWSGAVPIDVGSTGVFVSAQSRLGIQRSCNYSILFPNAQEGRPMVLQITPRWVFYNNTQKRLRIYFRFPGLAKAMQEAEKKRRQLQAQQAESQLSNANTNTDAATVSTGSSPECIQILRQADDNVSTLTSLATVLLNPGDYHVSCVGPIEGNQFCVQDVLEGVLPTITSITKDNRVEHHDVAAYYESHLTPYMDVDRPGEATFNLWAAPRAPGKRVAVSYGGDLVVQRPVFPHPTWLEPYDVYATDAVITGRIAVEVQNTENVLTVLLQPIQGTKILLQNRTARDTVMVRQQGSRRRNRIPPRQNRFFLWENARQDHRIRVHLQGFKGRWFDVDFSAGECQVTYHEDGKAAAAAEALAEAQQAHPWPTNVKSGDRPHTPFSFFVRGYANLEKTRVTIIVTESAIPLYASIDSWRTSAVLSLQVSMVQLSWIQEMSAGVATAMSLAIPLGAAAAGVDGGGGDAVGVPGADSIKHSDGDAEGQVIVVDAEGVRSSSRLKGDTNHAVGTSGNSGSSLLSGGPGSAMRQRGRSVFRFPHSLSPLRLGRSRDCVFPGGSHSFTSNPLLFSITLEGVQLERLSTEDTETFFFAIHQMQWIDEKQDSVFVYRARPRLPPVAAAAVAAEGRADTATSPLSSPSVGASRRNVSGARRPTTTTATSSFLPSSSSGRRGARTALQLPKAAAVAASTAANRVLGRLFGQGDAFLLAMEKPNDVELYYNYIKYADGVTRFTELRYVLTPLVVILTDFWLVDTIQEVRRLRVLLGLRTQATTTQTTTTTTVPMMMLTRPAPQQQQQQQQQSKPQDASPPLPPPAQRPPPVASGADADADGTVIAIEVPGGADNVRSKVAALRNMSSWMRCRTDSDVVIEADNDTATVAAVPPSSLSSTATATTTTTTAATTGPHSARVASVRASITPSPHNDKSSAKGHPLQDSPQDYQHGDRSDIRASSSGGMEATVSSPGITQPHTYAVTQRSRQMLTAPTHVKSPSSRSSEDSCGATRHHVTTPMTKQPSPLLAPASSTPAAAATVPLGTVAENPLNSTSHRSRTRRSVSQPQQRRHPVSHSGAATNTTGFVSQGAFLLQLVHEVRVRLLRQGTGVMAGSLAAIAAPDGKRGRTGGMMNPLRSVGGLVSGGGGRRRQFVPSTVRHHRGVLQRGGVGDGLAGAAAATIGTTSTNITATDPEGANSTAYATGGGVDTAASTTGMLTAANTAANSTNVNTASFMFIERLEVQRITLYVTFQRHRPDPLRPILGAYAWMLPSQLTQREFYLPAWTLTKQVETAASLQARLIKWGMHSLREQWTKVTKLGTLLDALQFWQHRTLPLHGAPQTLTLARVQQQRQGRNGQSVLFARCMSCGEDDAEDIENGDDEEEEVDGGAAGRDATVE